MALSRIAIAGIILVVLVIIYFVYQNIESGNNPGPGSSSFDCTSCETYICNKGNTACRTNCGTASDCVVAGATCTGNVCVPPAPVSCTADSCGVYTCNATTKQCNASCTGPSDTVNCSSPNLCNSSSQCVAPCTADSCGVYTCNATTKQCNASCTGPSDTVNCSGTNVCNSSSQCVAPCTADSCGVYTCNATTKQCNASCTGPSDTVNCSGTNVCNSSSQCGPPASSCNAINCEKPHICDSVQGCIMPPPPPPLIQCKSPCGTYACNTQNGSCYASCTGADDMLSCTGLNTCVSNVCTPPSPGAAGSCWGPMCSPYVCNTDGTGCLTSCAGTSDSASCAPGGTCIAASGGGFRCIIPIDCTTCSPYTCADAAGTFCNTSCSTNTDCISPTTCVNNICTPPTKGGAGQILNNCALCPGGCLYSISADGNWAQCGNCSALPGVTPCPGAPPPPMPPSSTDPFPTGLLQKSSATANMPGATLTQINTCADFAENTNIPWNQIALDWRTGGGAVEDCPAAMIIASGETSCTLANGCNIPTNNGGIWQVTSPTATTPSGCTDGSTNMCCNVDNIRTHQITYDDGGTACFGNFTNGFQVPDYVPGDHSGGGLAGVQPNFIGPFCHAGAYTHPAGSSTPSSLQPGVAGDQWGGGSEWFGLGGGGNDQLFPFPWYYYGHMLAMQDQSCNMFPSAPAAAPGVDCHCPQFTPGQKPSQALLDCYTNQIAVPAIAIATQICNTAYGTDSKKENKRYQQDKSLDLYYNS